MIDIIIVGTGEITDNCVRSIKRATKTPYNVIIEQWTGNYNNALNNGIEKSKAPYVALCNNDLIFTKGWDNAAMRALELYDSISPIDPYLHTITKNEEGYKIAQQLCGWCIIVKRSTLDKIGRLDERAKFWRSDYLYGLQLKRKKLKHAVIADCKVIHLGSQTLMQLSEQERYNLTIKEFRRTMNLLRV